MAREPFDADVVRREMRIIHDDLHCTAVRITGGDPSRIELAAGLAAEAGLEVWFCPFTKQLTQEELLALLADGAERAERLRRRGAEVVMCTGSEVSLMNLGFFPGETLQERLAAGRPLAGEETRRIAADVASGEDAGDAAEAAGVRVA